MSGARSRGRRSLGLLLSGLVLTALSLTMTGCGEEPKKPPELTGFSPAKPSVNANESLGIKVDYQENDYPLENFQWTAEAGAIDGDGQSEITYQAPDAAGDYKLTVTVGYGDDGAQLSLDTTVEVLAVEAAPEPEATPAAEAAPSTEGAAGQPAPTEGAGEAGVPVEAPPLGETPILEQPPIGEPPLPAEQIER